MTDDKIKVTAESRAHPNLRKLARALIALARRELDAEANAQAQRAAEGGDDKLGDAA